MRVMMVRSEVKAERVAEVEAAIKKTIFGGSSRPSLKASAMTLACLAMA
jgi:hypothetical protein